MSAAQVRRQVGAIFAESAQVDDARDAGGARGSGEMLRAHRLPLFESARVPQRVDEVIGDLNAFERRCQRRLIQDVAGDHARARADVGRKVRRMTSETEHLVSSCLQHRQEPSTDVARSARQENFHKAVAILTDC